MKRLKNVSVFLLALLLSLCVISSPALADFPWIENPGRGGQGSIDSPGPGGASVGTYIQTQPTVPDYSILMEISYRLAEFFVDDFNTTPTTKSSPAGTREEPTKVK